MKIHSITKQTPTKSINKTNRTKQKKKRNNKEKRK